MLSLFHSEEKLELAKRPGYGQLGKQVQIKANFFPLLQLPDMPIYQYQITFEPTVSNYYSNLLLHKLKEETAGVFEKDQELIYDSKERCFYSNTRLPFDSKSFELELNDNKFILEFELTSQLCLQNLLSPKYDQSKEYQEAFQFLNTLLRLKPASLLNAIGNSFFSRKNVISLTGGVECWMGYHQSLQPAHQKLLVNLDVSASAFFEPIAIHEFCQKVLNKLKIEELKRGLTDHDRIKIEKYLKGLKFVITHRGQMRKRFRILGLTKLDSTQLRFSLIEEQDISVNEYFLKQYNYRLKYPTLPCIKTLQNQKSTKFIYFPMEVCELVEGQKHLKKLNEIQTAKMIRMTCQDPIKRQESICRGLDEMGLKDNSVFKKYQLKLSNEMLTIDARVLQPPSMSFSDQSLEPVVVPKEGAWNLRNKKVAIGAHLSAWAFVCFGSSKDFPLPKLEFFLRELFSVCSELGIHVQLQPSSSFIIYYGKPGLSEIERNLKQAYQLAYQKYQKDPQLLFCLLPSSGVSFYAEIKRVCDTVLGVPSQCLQAKHVHQPKRQYCANVGLKLNIKLGGLNAFLTGNQISFLSEVPTILFGLDILHPSFGDLSRPSIAALVASMDAKAGRYVSSVRLQPNRKEIVQDLAEMVKELLITFFQTNGGLKPERILFYRDGISHQQFQNVLDQELTAIQHACQSLESGYMPTITFIVVQKRHHARFFPIESDTLNIASGTVVEKEVTNPFVFDFYLCSHAGLQGTSRPCHYQVLYDENLFTPDALQDFTFKLCFLYARCTRSVSIVPPVYYAHLVAFRSRFHLIRPDLGGIGHYHRSVGDLTHYDDDEFHFAEIKPNLHQVMYFM